MSVYATNSDTKYLFNLNQTDNAYYADCSEAEIRGEKKLLHNEVGFSFVLEDDEIHVIEGWHIGTEDFDFSEDEGDDCNYYVEHYHPGLLRQVKEFIDKEAVA